MAMHAPTLTPSLTHRGTRTPLARNVSVVHILGRAGRRASHRIRIGVGYYCPKFIKNSARWAQLHFDNIALVDPSVDKNFRDLAFVRRSAVLSSMDRCPQTWIAE